MTDPYGRWMRDEAERRIGHLYPDATGPRGEKLTPIAWIWARTVESPDPSWSGQVPLVATWTLSKRPGKPTVWIDPIIDRVSQTISYVVREGGEPTHERTVKRAHGTCIATGAAIPKHYIKAEGCEGRLGSDLMGVIAEQASGRVYCTAREDDAQVASCSTPADIPVGALARNPQYMIPIPYGMDEWWKLYTSRQLTALATFSDLVGQVKDRICGDAVAFGLADDGVRLRDGGKGAKAYADAVTTYLAFAVDKSADYWSTICTWLNGGETIGHTFGRQAIPMTWDFAECNPFSSSTGNWMAMVNWIAKALNHLPAAEARSVVVQRDSRALLHESEGVGLSTDPPYYDNVPYADISDFFYVWLRRNAGEIWPDECSTLVTPKAEELVANRVRAGSKQAAEAHFESGMVEFMREVAAGTAAELPATIYYAFKATESKDGQIRTTGWDTFLQAVIDAGLQVQATWPLRTERGSRLRGIGSNALATSVVLVCRPRPESAVMATRREFIALLREELPDAVQLLQSGNIAPVDMAQSAIGPGIKVFSRFSKVVEADGTAMPVSAALSIINDVLGEVLDGEEAELDRDTRFALTWFAEHKYGLGPAGDAESVAKAKNTSLDGLFESGIGEARAGKFRLYKRDELAPDWSPLGDERFTIWEALQYLVAALERSESEAADLLHTLGGNGDRARQLAYLLYQAANDKGWTAEAGAYNGLIAAWPGLREGALAVAARAAAPTEGQMF